MPQHSSGGSVMYSALFVWVEIVVIDFKGGKEEKQLFSNLGKYLPDRRIKVVNFPDQSFEIFIGSHKDIADKMIGFLPPLTNTPADFYIYRQMRAIRAVIENPNLSIPKTAEEVLSRIKNGAKFGSTNEKSGRIRKNFFGKPIPPKQRNRRE
jgi:hypothetical protein